MVADLNADQEVKGEIVYCHGNIYRGTVREWQVNAGRGRPTDWGTGRTDD